MKETLNSQHKGYTPETVGIEPLEWLAPVFVLPNPKNDITDRFARGGYTPRNEVPDLSGEKILRGLGFTPAESTEAAAAVQEFCEQGVRDSTCQEVTSGGVLDGIAAALHQHDLGRLERAHELQQLLNAHAMAEECELHALRLEINDAFNAGVTNEAILELDERDLMHVAINRVITELGYDD